MSAETIPAEVLYLIRKGGLFYRPNSQGYTAHTFDAGRYTLAEAEAITHPNGPDGPRDGLSYVPAPADRSTRPAEPAAPVAEAGDGEVALKSLLAAIQLGHAAYDADESSSDLSAFREAYGAHNAIEQLLANLRSTLEDERARAAQAEADLHEVEEQFAKLQEAEAQAEEEACLRVAAEASLSRVLQDRDFWKERFQVESRSRIQAEQRAADALARAEKAEGALAEAQGALVDLADWLENDCGAELPHSHIEKQVAIARDALPRDLSQGGQHG